MIKGKKKKIWKAQRQRQAGSIGFQTTAERNQTGEHESVQDTTNGSRCAFVYKKNINFWPVYIF